MYVDSDHAGCRRTRKSTSGGVAMLGQHILMEHNITQPVVALSSGESEFYAIIKGITTGQGKGDHGQGALRFVGRTRHGLQAGSGQASEAHQHPVHVRTGRHQGRHCEDRSSTFLESGTSRTSGRSM